MFDKICKYFIPKVLVSTNMPGGEAKLFELALEMVILIIVCLKVAECDLPNNHTVSYT